MSDADTPSGTSRAIPSPIEIATAIGERVIGQENAVREVAVAISKHLAGLKTGNILMIGSSGTGKTTLMRAVEGWLASRDDLVDRSTLVRIHANVLADDARTGRPGQAVLGRLLERARERFGAETPVETLLSHASRGLVFVDEVDKIRAQIGERPNVEGIRAQEALLTLIENEAVQIELPDWAGGGLRTIDSSSLLFICGGAFEGLYDSVYDRVTIGADRGALQPVTVVDGGQVDQQNPFSLRDWLRNEDLFDYGMSPQFLSRFDAVILLEDLGVDELIQIFLEVPDSSFLLSRAYFAARGIRMTLSRAAIDRIARAAASQPRLGARALKEVFRRVIRDFEFDPDQLVTSGVLLIDEANVEAALADP